MHVIVFLNELFTIKQSKCSNSLWRCTWLFKTWFWFYIWDSFKITKIIFQFSGLYTKTQHRVFS